MTNSERLHPASVTKTKSARVLYDNRELILGEWVDRVKAEVNTAGKLLKPIVIDTMPLFIEHLAESLCIETNRQLATENSNIGQAHGGERARVTRYGPEQVIQEYIILREIIRAKILAFTPLSDAEEDTIRKSFDKGIQESMNAYFVIHARVREQFVAALTHDLRNPINAAKLAADLILDSASDQPTPELMTDIKDLSARALKSLKRADRMIQDLLDASVVQIGEPLTLNLSECDLDTIVRGAVSDRAAKEMERLEVKSLSLRGHWDPDAFQRSLENLINNAFKYGAPGTPVTVEAQAIHDRIMVSVHNWGNPIPVKEQENLFQIFNRAEAAKAGKIQGWGIGLALARSTAEKLGGSLGVESTADKGTVFTIDVPRDARPFQ